MRLVYALLAAGTALTNSTTETVLASKSLDANFLQAGKVLHVRGAVRATATNSTDTLLVNVRVGPTTLTGTIVAAAAATDAVDNDVVMVDLMLVVRSVDLAAGTAVVIVSGFISALGAEGTGTARAAFESLSIANINAALLVQMTGTWSVASASNSAQAESMVITELA